MRPLRAWRMRGRPATARASVCVLALALLPPLTVIAGDDEGPAVGTGSICVAPLPLDVRAQDKQSSSFRQLSYRFSIQVDSGQPVEMTRKEGVRITDLELAARHLVRIRDGGELLQSFRFSFAERGAPDLCLWYRPGRQTWILEPPRPDQPRCRCAQSKTSSVPVSAP